MNFRSMIAASAALFLLVTVGWADIVINVDVPDGRGDGDAGVPTVTDFTTQNPGLLLDASTTFYNSTGGGNSSNFGNNFGGGVAVGGFTVTTSDDGGGTGTGTNSGYNAGDDSHNDLNPITEGYAFNAQDTVVTISGLLANSSAGDTLILAAWGIGDNVGQQAEFVTTYGSNTAAEGNTQATLYNGPGEARSSAVGSVPFVNFTFTADGVTDTISFAINPTAGSSGTVINAFGLSVTPAAVPEPSTIALLAFGAMGLITRRRR